MLDFSHLPNAQNGADVQVFRNVGQWTTWTKPRGKSMFHVLLISGGGGGGGGFTRAAGSAGGGGAGGGGASSISAMGPLRFLPDILYVNVGSGGAGGAASASGAAGGQSLLMLAPDASVNIGNRILSTGGGTAGGAGSATAGGVTGGTVTATSLLGPGQIMVNTGYGGPAGTAGGAQTGAVGTGYSFVNGLTSPGTGGGGSTTTDFAGGAYTGSGFWPSLAGGVAAGGRGNDGLELSNGGVWMPIAMIFLPGTGGGSNNAGTGGAGGNGGPGCGGGGGGAGTTGGAGGKGGDGLVIIASW